MGKVSMPVSVFGKPIFQQICGSSSPSPPPKSFSSLSFHIPANEDTSDELLNMTISLLLLNFILSFIPNIPSSFTPSVLATIHACNFSTVFSTYFQIQKTAQTYKHSIHLLHGHVFDSCAY